MCRVFALHTLGANSAQRSASLPVTSSVLGNQRRQSCSICGQNSPPTRTMSTARRDKVVRGNSGSATSAAPPMVAAALENSADPVAAPNGALEPVVRQGSGLVDIDDAIQATTRITPGTLSLGDDADRTRQTLTIENRGRSTVTYALSAAAAS